MQPEHSSLLTSIASAYPGLAHHLLSLPKDVAIEVIRSAFSLLEESEAVPHESTIGPKDVEKAASLLAMSADLELERVDIPSMVLSAAMSDQWDQLIAELIAPSVEDSTALPA